MEFKAVSFCFCQLKNVIVAAVIHLACSVQYFNLLVLCWRSLKITLGLKKIGQQHLDPKNHNTSSCELAVLVFIVSDIQTSSVNV